MMEFLV